MLSGEVAVEILDAVDHRRIGLQGYAAPQPVVEDGGDKGHFRLVARLLLDDRGEGHQLVQVQAPRS